MFLNFDLVTLSSRVEHVFIFGYRDYSFQYAITERTVMAAKAKPIHLSVALLCTAAHFHLLLI